SYTLGYRSVLWDPRFLTYSGALTFNRNALSLDSEANASQQTGFKANASLFPTRPFRGTFRGSRSVGADSASYPESGLVRSGLSLPPGLAPELRTGSSELGMNLQLASTSLPRVELGFQEGSSTIAAGSLSAIQRQSSLQALVASESPRL